jgi:hypothetical protein
VEDVAVAGYDFDQMVAVEFGHQSEPIPFDELPEWAQETHLEKARAVLALFEPESHKPGFYHCDTHCGGPHEPEAVNHIECESRCAECGCCEHTPASVSCGCQACSCYDIERPTDKE